MKGQNSRSGGGVRPSFEGGQLPLVTALPKMRGFTNNFRKRFSTVNIGQFSRFPENSEVTPQVMNDAGVIRGLKFPVKVLGDGELTVPLIVEAHRFSGEARRKIEAAGGTAQEIG